MKVTQIATILNEISNEMIGESAVVNEDLSNIVDIGRAFTNVLTADGGVDNYVKKIMDKVGRVINVDRKYTGGAPDIIRDNWEYGSVLEKIRVDLPKAAENDTWKLVADTKYDDFAVFTPPNVSTKYWNKRITYETKVSYGYEQVKSSFASPATMNAFFANIENRIRSAMAFYNTSLAKRTVNNLIAQKIHSKNNVVNLLTEYNTAYTATLTAEKALTDKNFLRYAATQIQLYRDYITEMSMLYNDTSYVTFTPYEYQHLTLLSQFDKAMITNMQADTFHDDLVKVGTYDTVPWWQGSGTDDNVAFAEASKLDVTIEGSETAVTQDGVVGVLFDRDAAMVCCENYRVTSFYNPSNETTKFYYKWDAMYMNDTAENCVVFVIADAA